MARTVTINLAILAFAVASLVQATAGKTLVVGDGLGWLVPPGGDLAYATWAAINNFTVGDVLCMYNRKNSPKTMEDIFFFLLCLI